MLNGRLEAVRRLCLAGADPGRKGVAPTTRVAVSRQQRQEQQLQHTSMAMRVNEHGQWVPASSTAQSVGGAGGGSGDDEGMPLLTTPLHQAAERGELEMVIELCSAFHRRQAQQQAQVHARGSVGGGAGTSAAGGQVADANNLDHQHHQQQRGWRSCLDGHGDDPLETALRHGQERVARFLEADAKRSARELEQGLPSRARPGFKRHASVQW